MSDTHHSDSSVGQYERMMLGELLAYQGSSRILARWDPVRFMDAGTFSRVFLVRNRQTGEEAVL